MKPPTAPEWRAILMRLYKARRDPFDGRGRDLLLGVGMYLSTSARGGSRVALKAVREAYGERLVRRHVGVLVASDLLVMVQRPTRGRDGKPGRMAIYEFRDPESLPLSVLQGGSENYGAEGQRSCSAGRRALEAVQARSLPPNTLKRARLTSSARPELVALLSHFVARSA